jgi:hypothetical protein
MLLFVGVAIVLMVVRNRVFFSWWMAAYALIVVWGVVVTFGWAIDRAESLAVVGTLVVNAGFFFFLFQYLLLRADMRRYMAMFVLAVTALVLYALLHTVSIDWDVARFGLAAGINPNWIGMLSAIAFGLSMVLAKKKSAFWLMSDLLLLPAIFLSKSMKAAALAALLFVAVILILFPKRGAGNCLRCLFWCRPPLF